MKRPRLHVSNRPARVANGHPPLVFVHGGYIHSGCWDLNFLPHFNALGYHCHALDLSGHGASEGKDDLHRFDIDHYAADVAHVVDALPKPPVLVGHSMGALVVQRYLEKGRAAGVVLMAPVPTTGLAAATAQLAARQPDFLVEAARAVRGRYTEKTVRVMRETYFSPDVTPEEFTAFKPLVQDESTTAIAEMMALAWRPPSRSRPRIPALVIGGEKDAIFPSNQLHFTASGWNAETFVVPRAGHMIMMEPHWTVAAQKIENWMVRRLGPRLAAAA